METLTRILFVAAAALGVASAQPSLYTVANSASYDSSAIAQGSLLVLFGYAMGPATLIQAPSFPLQTNLGGTSVRIVSGGTSLQCPMVYASSTQVAAILPSNTPIGQASIYVTFNGLVSSPPDFYFGPVVNVVASAVGIYALNSQGNGPGIFTAPDGSVTGFAKTAKAGDVLTLWATGIGGIAGDDSMPPKAGNVPGVEVYVGNQAAGVLYAGPSPCCAGLDQISFQMPAVANSCFMPVLVRSGGIVSNVVTVPVSAQNGSCEGAGPEIPSSIYSRAVNGENLKVATFMVGPMGFMARVGFDSAQFLATSLTAALHTPVSKRDAAALLHAIEARSQNRIRRAMGRYARQWSALDPKVRKWLLQQVNLTRDAASAAFGDLSSSGSLMALLAGDLPPAGTCAIVQQLPNANSVSSSSLDAGSSLTLNGPAGQIAMSAVQSGQYQGLFGNSVTGPDVPPGVYTIAGKGGKDLAAFTASLSIGANLVWTNKAPTTSLDRSQPLTVTWTGGTVPGHVLVGGYQNGSKAFFCAEDAGKGTFTVPALFLSAFKASSEPVTLFIGPHPLEHQIAIPGLDIALFVDGSTDSVIARVK